MMTVMLIRRNLRRSTTTTSSNYYQSQPAAAAHLLHPSQQSTSSFLPHPTGAQIRGVAGPALSSYRRSEPPPPLSPYQYRTTVANPLKSALRMTTTYNSPTRAMRYYRIWIYTCNTVLFVCVFGFIVVACSVLVVNPRRSLIPDFTLFHPSLLYLYAALILQCGFVQAIGYFGAKSLNERLLNIYWYSLLLLLIGDILFGVFWYHHFEYIVGQMTPALKERFNTEYGTSDDFTNLWNMIQSEDQCCGVDSYGDFYQNKTFVTWGTTIDDEVTYMPTLTLPSSCCRVDIPMEEENVKPPEARRNMPVSTTTTSTTVPPLPPIFATDETIAVTDMVIMDGIKVTCSRETEFFYSTGCERRLVKWFTDNRDTLFVIGYCVIFFLKLCFVGILRNEINEMIRKIKILRSEQRSAVEQETYIAGMQKIAQIRRYDHNGSVVGMSAPLIERDGRDADSVTTVNDDGDNDTEMPETSVTSPFLVLSEKQNGESSENVDSAQETPVHNANAGGSSVATHRRHLAALNNDLGNDSDTNSHCALIIQEEKSTKPPRPPPKSSSNNSSFEMQELDRRLVSRNRTKI